MESDKLINEIGEILCIKLRLINIEKQKGNYENLREFPIYSEWIGMLRAFQMMGIKIESVWNKDCTYIVAEKVNGKRFDVYDKAHKNIFEKIEN